MITVEFAPAALTSSMNGIFITFNPCITLIDTVCTFYGATKRINHKLMILYIIYLLVNFNRLVMVITYSD